MREITIPISDEDIRSLHAGDPVELTGIMMTGRDAVHKWISETFIKKTREPQGNDLQVYEEIKKYLAQGVLYHCGPVVAGVDTKEYKFVAAGPTTSIREEPYQADVMKHFNIKVGISVQAVNKVSEGPPHIVDLLQSGEISLSINTPLGSTSFSDGLLIRTESARLGIPLVTTLTAAQAAVNGIKSQTAEALQVRSLQDLHHNNS